ncbi:MAG: phosphoribosylaminoimidazolesuccinocarboxamide synthase [Actinomycetota bacterium]|nr:phosphoribosylaminoimidazolesuccinocarboxamide synthase [Actinomycetota bacterium]MDD5667562.1 phosphoribosylaminoimidazolesuccinocarboxamide synthase [Actinomycetota bacterium]
MGSVKDLTVIREPRGAEAGLGRFVYSDRYSVFDWGEMPDHIEGKGKAICMASAFFFEGLEEKGIKTHYAGIVEDGIAKKTSELREPGDTMEVGLVRVIEPAVQGDDYDYSVFTAERGNFLIPLEVMYRNSLPAGSSVFKRLEDGSLKPADIGLDGMPEPGQLLERPMLDVSTKLESSDRYIDWEEARRISGMDKGEIEEMQRIVLLIDDMISGEAGRLGLSNEDGKVEFGFDGGRDLVLVDALGTLDECRFSYRGLPVSKEIARIHYRGTDWHRDTEEAKKKGLVDWKSLVKSSPEPLPPQLARAISQLYQAYANELARRQWFDVPPLAEVLSSIERTLGQR